MAALCITISLLAHAATLSHSTIHTAFFISPSFRRSSRSGNAAIKDKAVGKITLLTKLKVSNNDSTTNTPYSQITLPRLLELLHERNIRYPPNATREQLEALLRRGPKEASKATSTRRSRSRVDTNNNRDDTKPQVVDVEVLPDQPSQIDNTEKRRSDYSQYKRVRRRNGSKSDNRQRKRIRKHKLYTDVIDAEFDLPPNEDDSTYNNGLQIFVMGFVEAGKTAAELAIDAAASTIRAPFVESNTNNGWYYDNGGSAKSREYKRETRRRRSTRPRSIGRDYNVAPILEQKQDSYDGSDDLACIDDRTEQLLDIVPSAKINSTQTKQRSIPRSRNRSHDSDRPIYGLGYVHDESSERTSIQHQYKRQWKDRLRNKFDAALGLDATTRAASKENESYYDSWKRNMKAMDDSHKDRLRRNMQDDKKVSRATVSVNSTRVPQNRRARMRAAKNGIKNEESSCPSVQIAAVLPSNAPRIQKYKSKLRPEEKPFWKERGSISSLLFDNNPSLLKKSMKKNKKSLEVSPSEQCIHTSFCHNIWLKVCIIHYSNYFCRLLEENVQSHP